MRSLKMSANRILLGQILLRKKLITQKELDEALQAQKATKEFLGTILIRKGIIKERDLLEALSEQLGIPFGSIKDAKIDWDLVGKFSKSLILEHRCFPVDKTKDSVIFAITNPLDAWAIAEAERQMPGYKIMTMLIAEGEMEGFIEMYRNFAKSKIRRLLE
jgi:hypothetical protein